MEMGVIASLFLCSETLYHNKVGHLLSSLELWLPRVALVNVATPCYSNRQFITDSEEEATDWQ